MMEEKLRKETGVIPGQLTAAFATYALALVMNGDLTGAVVHLEHSIRYRRQMPSFSKLVLYTPLLYWSAIDFLQGQYQDALAKLQRLLDDREEQYGKNDTESKRYAFACLNFQR